MVYIAYYFLGMYLLISALFAVCLGIRVYRGIETGEYEGWEIPVNYITLVISSFTIWPVLLAARALNEFLREG